MITDEMVDKAKTTFTRCAEKQAEWDIAVRAALEAVESALIAQGMREAADLAWNNEPDGRIANLIEARAQELDPQ